jgi:hypothetical protein
VTIEDQIVLTGGTMLGLGKVKPVWLAEIGTRTAESFDGENWYSLPSLSRAKVCIKSLQKQYYSCQHLEMNTLMPKIKKTLWKLICARNIESKDNQDKRIKLCCIYYLMKCNSKF